MIDCMIFSHILLMTAKNITDIVNGICTYEEINKWSEIKMRNRKNGIKLPNVMYYQFVYSKKIIRDKISRQILTVVQIASLLDNHTMKRQIMYQY